MIEVRLSGLNSARTIDQLIRLGIKIKKVRRDRELTFLIKARDRMKILGVFPDAKMSYYGWQQAIRTTLKRGAVIGLVASVLLVCAFSSFTYGVRVSGALDYGAEIMDYLSKRGYGALRLKSSVDCEEIERVLMQEFPLSVVSACVDGGYVHVLVKEELKPGTVADLREKTSLVSNYDGVITRVVVTGGTAQVKVGSAVRRGQVLVENYTTIGEERIPVRAEGEVYAKIALRKSRTVGKTALAWKRSGKTATVSYTDVFGIVNCGKSPFEHYEFEETRVRTGDILPIYAVFRTYFELVGYEVECDYQADVERVKQELRQELLADLPAGAEEIDFFCTLRDVSGRIEVCAVLETEIIISVRPSKDN